MQKEFVLPGTTGPTLCARRRFLRDLELSIDGRELKRHGFLRHSWYVQADDGRTYDVRAGGGFSRTYLEVEGQQIELEPPLPVWLRVVMLLPLLLVFVGGAIGGACGGVAVEINRRLARSELALPVRLGSMLLAGVAAAGLWFGVSLGLAWFLAPLPAFAEGACYAGYWEDADREWVKDDALQRVSCTEPHDAEVAGGFELSGGSYPSVDEFDAWAALFCPAEFERYVGVRPERSSLALNYYFPDQTLWSRGGRDIDCFVTTAGPGQVVDYSVRDSGL